MKNEITLKRKPLTNPVYISLPVSKSEYNRASIISYLSGRKVILKNHSDADDSIKMDDLISQISDGKVFYLNCGAAGTTFRFLLSVAALSYGEWTMTGSERMKNRPVGILVDALRNLGAEISYLEKEGFPPLKVTGKKLHGGVLKLDASISSQFISSLMMIGPVLENGLEIHFESKPVSFPYVKMTAELMRKCGAKVATEENKIIICTNYYGSAEITCENDWSAASYFYSFVSVNPQLKFYLNGLKKESLQGDSVVAKIYSVFGIETSYHEKGVEIYHNQTVCCDYFEFDFTDCPDLAQTLAFTCCALRIPGKLTGLTTLKNKETDRIIALKNELEKCGMKCMATNDSLSFIPETELPTKIHFNTYEDHRMAMAASVMALICDEITMENKKVVEKSFPQFWDACNHFMEFS